MFYTTFQHKGCGHYIDSEGYCSMVVNHSKGEYVTLANHKHTMSLHKFHRYIVELLGIECYHDATMEEYIKRTSDKKLKDQGLKRIES